MNDKKRLSNKDNQHTIPQWYLRNFSPDKENKNIPKDKKRIYYLDKHTGRIKCDKIQNIAYSEHFFNKKKDKKLQIIETRASDITRHVIKEESLDYIVNAKKKMFNFCEYVIFQLVRTTTMRRDIRTIVDTESSRVITDEIKSKFPIILVDYFENISTDESIIKIIQGSLIDFDVMKGWINELVFNKIPFLVFNNTQIPFLTNDNPIMECDSRMGLYPAIMDECNYSLIFTISPTLAIVFLEKSDVKKNPILTKSEVKMVIAESEIKLLNKNLIEKADRYVFSNNQLHFFPLN